MALTFGRRLPALAAAAIALAALLTYLRDPPWLIDVTSGLRGWEQSQDGVRFRWMDGHASFFVPSGAGSIEIPLRAEFDRPDDWPIDAEISIDDTPAVRVTLTDDRWQRVRLALPPPGSRRVRRIDIRVNRSRPGERGLQVGEIACLELGTAHRRRGEGEQPILKKKRVPFSRAARTMRAAGRADGPTARSGRHEATKTRKQQGFVPSRLRVFVGAAGWRGRGLFMLRGERSSW